MQWWHDAVVYQIYPRSFRDSDGDGIGDLAGVDRLIAGAHARGLRLLMDLVPCHTSTAHPWFAERPDFYVWARGRGDGPPNNWLSAFGGSAWSRDPAGGPRWYLHSFYPEQADLDWRNPEVVQAMQGIVRFWLDRGVDGFRLDAIDRLVKDAALRDDGPASAPFALPPAQRYSGVAGLGGQQIDQ